MTYAAQDDLLEALKCFEQSEVLDEKNVMNRFQKANVLCKLEKYEKALQELEQLRSAMPKEAPIPQLIGKIYKQLGMIEKAHSFFTLALDLENKDSQKIKAMIDSLHNMNEFNDDNDM
jgi:anaphase-promoting complex subunit 3